VGRNTNRVVVVFVFPCRKVCFTRGNIFLIFSPSEDKCMIAMYRTNLTNGTFLLNSYIFILLHDISIVNPRTFLLSNHFPGEARNVAYEFIFL